MAQVMPDATFDGALEAAISRWGLRLEPEQIARLRAHFQAVVEANQRFNLTRITEPDEAAVRHYADSLALLLWCRDRGISARSVLDIGSGAGYPAVPLAVARPEWAVTALESTIKKARFLQRVTGELGLITLTVIAVHSAHWKSPAKFDLIVFRAVAPLDVCLKRAAHHAAPGGWLVAYKTASLPADEKAAAGQVVASLKLRRAEPYGYELSFRGEVIRHALFPFQSARR